MSALILDFCRSDSPEMVNNRAEDNSAEILVVAGILTDSQLLVRNRFHMLLRQRDNSDISDKRLHLLSLKKRQFVFAKSPEAFAAEVRSMVEEADTLVFWNRNSYETLRDFFHALGLEFCNHQVIILQDELGVKKYGVSCGLKRVLMHFKITVHEKELVNPKTRINYLLRLFRILPQVRMLGRGVTEKRIVQNMKIFDSLYAEMIGDVFGIKCAAEEGILHVQTEIASWIIYHDEGRVLQVYHENVDYGLTMKDKTLKDLQTIPKYHKQNLDRILGKKTVYNVVQYIRHHDLQSIEIAKGCAV